MKSDGTLLNNTVDAQNDSSNLEGELQFDSHTTVLGRLRKTTKPQKITFLILFLFLLIRITDAYWPFLIFHNDVIWMMYYVGLEFVAFSYVLWLNKNDLARLNINKLFLIIFLLSGLLISWFLWWPFGIVIIGGAVIHFINLRKDRFHFNQIIVDSRRLFKPIELVLFGIYLLFFLVVILSRIYQEKWLGEISWIVSYRIWGVIFEEMLFRGMLWMFLAFLGLQDKKIVFVQALIFWIAHNIGISSIFFFWFFIPSLGLWLGALVERSKSLIPSTIVHSIISIALVISRNFA